MCASCSLVPGRQRWPRQRILSVLASRAITSCFGAGKRKRLDRKSAEMPYHPLNGCKVCLDIELVGIDH